MPMPRRRSGLQTGFTLVETMVVVTIVAILAALAAPTMQEALDRYRVNAVYDDLRSTFMLARSEAIRTRQQVVIARVGGANCGTSQEWKCGWTVFVDLNANNTFNSPTETVSKTQAALPGDMNIMTIPANAGRILIDRWGNIGGLGLRQVITPHDAASSPATTTLCITSGSRIRKLPGEAQCN